MILYRGLTTLGPHLHYAVRIWKRKWSFWKSVHEMFFVHTTSEEFWNATITGHFRSMKNSAKDVTSCIDGFKNLRFQNVFPPLPHQNGKIAFSNPSGLKSAFVKLRFRDRLVWKEGLKVEIKIRFQARIQGRWNGWIFTPLFLSPLLSFFSFSCPSNIDWF